MVSDAPAHAITDCGPDGGCEECDVCRYLNFLEWAESVAPAGSTIERNEEIERYLRERYPATFGGGLGGAALATREWDGPLTSEEQAMIDAAWEKHRDAQPCLRPPQGWYCTRSPGHSGPCAALPIPPNPWRRDAPGEPA